MLCVMFKNNFPLNWLWFYIFIYCSKDIMRRHLWWLYNIFNVCTLTNFNKMLRIMFWFLLQYLDGKRFHGKGQTIYVCNQEIQQQRYKMMLCFTIIKVRDQTIWWWKRFCFAITSFLRGPTLGYSLVEAFGHFEV